MASSIKGKPTIMPKKCGRLFRTPKFMLLVMIIRLLGPGVIMLKNANRAMA